MSLYRRIHHVLEFEDHPIQSPSPSPIASLLSLIETTSSKTLLTFPSPLDLFDPVPPPFLTQILRRYTYTPPPVTYSELSGSDLHHVTTLSDRLAALESTVNKLAKPKPTKTDCTWTAEINTDDGIQRRYQWTAKFKADDVVEAKAKKKNKAKVKNCKWSSEIKERGEHASVHKYSVELSTGQPKIRKGKKEDHHRHAEIEEISANLGALVLKQVFAKRAGALDAKGKKKELSPEDAAVLIQNSFRAYLIRRSKALRGLRELAVAKNKFKELGKLFNNFSYRRRIAHDAEECQKFTERIIVVLLTLDAIEGVDVMIRAAKRSMVDELEAMLDVVDPQPAGVRSLSIRRRTFDLPTGGIQKDIAAGVAQVVKMLNEEENGTEDSTFEACL